MTLEAITIEELLNRPVSELEAISDNDLTQALAKYFDVTRPENAGKQGSQGRVVKSIKPAKSAADWEKEEKKKAAFELARKMGINLKAL
jgi:hypothetical protein